MIKNFELEKFSQEFKKFNIHMILQNFKFKIIKDSKLDSNFKTKLNSKLIDLFQIGEDNSSKNSINKQGILESKFISLPIRNYINKNIKYNLSLQFSVDDLILNIDTFFTLQKDVFDFLEEIKNIGRIFAFINHYFEKNENLNLIIYCLEKPKVFNKSQRFLTADNVNSGMTSYDTRNSNNNFIVIWRKEEFWKVYIHELIHYLGLDMKFNNSYNQIKNLVCLDSKSVLIPNEAFTDFFAIIFYLLIITKGNNQEFKKLLKIQTNFIINQAAKIIYIYGYNKIEELINNKNCKILMKQESCIFSYYIIKAALFYKFNDSLNFFSDSDYQIKYQDYIISLLNSSGFKDMINSIILKNGDNILKNTSLRMISGDSDLKTFLK